MSSEQDKGLDILAQSIARQKQLGLTIGEELDDHNGLFCSFHTLPLQLSLDAWLFIFHNPSFLSSEMLDELSMGVDRTGSRIKRETAHVIEVSEKAKSGGKLCCDSIPSPVISPFIG